ncbi:MAG: deoxyribose-phosphate aldolase [Synergistes sp.]|nr:deoxyribose-phosphate aldolase [Synergistes sp.]
MNLAQYIDHTNLKADASEKDICRLCVEAAKHGFASVCVNSSRTEIAATCLEYTDVAVCTVVGFPLGAASTAAKCAEAQKAAEDGANEIDMVMNIGLLKDGAYKAVADDIRAVVRSVPQCTVKVIIETCMLTTEEKICACQLAEAAGAHFIKTSTGFAASGASEEDIRLIRSTVGNRMKIKAAGGIHDARTALAMIEAGADRIGASRSIEICRG